VEKRQKHGQLIKVTNIDTQSFYVQIHVKRTS